MIDTQSTKRRGGLKRRNDLRGVEIGVQWAKTRLLGLQISPQEEGVWYSIIAGGILTRERLYRHGRLKGLAGQNSAKCIMPMCIQNEDETREHRYWHCVQHEHLRSDEFKKMRLRLMDMHPCEKQCGIATLNGNTSS